MQEVVMVWVRSVDAVRLHQIAHRIVVPVIEFEPTGETRIRQKPLLVTGKKWPKTGVRKIYGKKSVRATNLPLVFSVTSGL